ncbi:hypothetical protein [Leifsonia aquatica]|uniref:hypothetical protein n=1 Tax=Leifsonia aquatica TaxID=144185 RepID=UPI00046A45BF|nr:hypothetical protein [Leifsonia aquatica]
MSARRARIVVFAVAALGGLVLLSGCSAPAPAGTPTRTAVAASPTASPAVAAAPTVRVPTTCDRLVPADVVAGAFRTAVQPVTVEAPRVPAGYADDRAGVLTCVWSSVPADRIASEKALYGWVTVVPDATRADVDAQLAGSMFGGSVPVAGVLDTVESCSASGYQWCGFVSYPGNYAVIGGVWDYGDPTYESQSKTIAALATASVPVVRALAAPAPLWQPPGAGLSGAGDCDAMLTHDQIQSASGLTGLHVVKADDGEYAFSTLGTNSRVDSYSCTWSADQQAGIGASVLPGGAGYALSTRPADAVDVSGLGDSAFRSGDTLDVIAAGGWVQVAYTGSAANPDVLVALAKQELANVGYRG